MPYVKIYLSGLEPEAYYSVQLRFVTTDKYSHHHDRSTMMWRKIPKILTEHNPVTSHRDYPNSGKFWMSEAVSFCYVKLTTNPEIMNSHVRKINSFLNFACYSSL